jgi:prepilin-type processing-associated H-X9-DG protein
MRKSNRGFTRFEILCVAGVVLAQAAVLQPAIRRTSEQDRMVTCKLNIKRCVTAVMMYCNDYDDKLPSSVIAADPPGSSPTQAQVVDFLTGKGGALRPIGSTRALTWAQALDGYTDVRSFCCPSDTPRSRVSYWWKYAADLAWRNSAIQARSLSDYNYAAIQVILYEHAGWHGGDAAGIKDGVKVNVAYIDGHVSTITVRNGPPGYPSASDERGGQAAIRLGEPMYFNYDYTTQTRHPGVADYIDPRRYTDSF